MSDKTEEPPYVCFTVDAEHEHAVLETVQAINGMFLDNGVSVRLKTLKEASRPLGTRSQTGIVVILRTVEPD